MSLETGLVAELLADATVSSIVGTKVHPEAMPQNTNTPAIVYSRIATDREQHLGGQRDLIAARVRIDSWQTSYALAWTLADAVRSALLAVTSDLGGFTVQQVRLEDERNLSEFEGDRRDYRISQEFVIMYTEA